MGVAILLVRSSSLQRSEQLIYVTPVQRVVVVVVERLLRERYFKASGDTAKLPGPRSRAIRLY